MIEILNGKILKKEPTHLVVDVQGVGYGMDVSLKTSEKMVEIGKPVSIFTHLHVKEGIFELYGFGNEIEKKVFLQLISVSGIGPKVALRILSSLQPEELIQKVLQGNVQELTALKGIGKKTAEVMVASLKSPLSKLNLGEVITEKFSQSGGETNDAIQALITLGVKEIVAQRAVQSAQSKIGKDVSTSVLISEALQLV